MTNWAISRIKKITIMLRVSFQLVFSKWIYVAIAIALAGIFWIIFNVFDQLLFFSPIFVFYLPDDAAMGFILSTMSAILMGIVVSMNVYILKYSGNLKVNIGSLFSGSTLSMISSMCASCSSVGSLLISTFGGIGITASTFLSNYHTPLRVISVALLVWALYSASNKLTRGCVLNHNIDHETKNL
ncbi:MAG: hypothetical protein ACJ72R_12780 [Nitrososphaeraceae archaeon]